jgi:hypothetical protein
LSLISFPPRCKAAARIKVSQSRSAAMACLVGALHF